MICATCIISHTRDHKYSTYEILLAFYLVLLNSAKLPGIGNRRPSAQSEQQLAVPSGSIQEYYRSSTTTLQEFRSVQSLSPKTTPRYVVCASIILSEGRLLPIGYVTSNYGFFTSNLSLRSAFRKSCSLQERSTTPEVVKYLCANRQANTFLFNFSEWISKQSVANPSSPKSYPLLAYLSESTITLSNCFPVNMLSISAQLLSNFSSVINLLAALTVWPFTMSLL